MKGLGIKSISISYDKNIRLHFNGYWHSTYHNWVNYYGCQISDLKTFCIAISNPIPKVLIPSGDCYLKDSQFLLSENT